MMGCSSDSQNGLYLYLLPDLIVRDVFKNVNRSPTRARDSFILRLLCPNVRRIVSKPLTHVSTLELSRVGGRIRDLKYVPELSSFHLDFENYNGDDFYLLKSFVYLTALTITNIDLKVCPRPRNDVFDTTDEIRHLRLEQDRHACSILCLFRFIPFLRGGTTRASMPAFQFLTDMTALRHLTIDGSTKCFRAVLPLVLKVPHLETLSIHLLNFKGYEVRELRRLRADLDLTLDGPVSKEAFRELRRIPTLTSLTLLQSLLSSFSFRINKLRALRCLSIQCSTLDARDLMCLSGLGTRLTSLRVKLTETDPKTLKLLCEMNPPLTALLVTMDSFQCDESLGKCTKLESLRIETTTEFFSGADLRFLKHLTKLKDFHAVGCMDWSPVLSLPSFRSNLFSLTISWSNVNGVVLEELRKLSSLTNLTLHLCPVLDTLSPLRDMSQLRSLTILQCARLEESFRVILQSSLPEGLEQLKLGFGDGLDLEAHEDLVLMLSECYPDLEVLPATRISDFDFTS